MHQHTSAGVVHLPDSVLGDSSSSFFSYTVCVCVCVCVCVHVCAGVDAESFD